MHSLEARKRVAAKKKKLKTLGGSKASNETDEENEETGE